MASASEPIQNSTTLTSKTKKNKKKKKAAAAKAEAESQAPAVNGASNHADEEDVEDGEEEPETPVPEVEDSTAPEPASSKQSTTNGHASQEIDTQAKVKDASDNTSQRLDALAKERDNLRAEVTELRKSLESIQTKHEKEASGLKAELEETRNGKEHAETQYRNLLGKVNTIRSQLGERLKQDAEELGVARTQIEELEEQNRGMKEANESLEEDVQQLRKTNEQQASEISSLRSRSNMSQQNWVQERDELIQKEAYVREEFENARQAMQDWEVLAMEERSLRENLGEKASELEEQLSSMQETYQSVTADRDAKVSTLATLQRRVQEEHDARRKELRELVEQSETQLEELRKKVQLAETIAADATSKFEIAQKELERTAEFESQVKEKNLLIGKLRHEAVILNDHLRKALRLLRKGKPEDNVDRNIVTNHFLHFLALDRSDPKKFQILQLIAALLNWSDDQREQAGLSRPGGSNASLRIPLSPFRRTPSTPSLGTDSMLMTESSSAKESLAELWSNFLEQEAAAGEAEGKSSPLMSRRESGASPGDETGLTKDKGRAVSHSGLGIS